MPVLYVTEYNAVVRKQAGSLIVTVDIDPDGKGPLPERRHQRIEVEPHHIETVAIVGKGHITSDATLFCLEQGISVVWLSFNGKFLGRLTPDRARNADLRIAQYSEYIDSSKRLNHAQSIVRSKINNMKETLADLRNNATDKTPYKVGMDGLETAVGRAGSTVSLESLLGVEGNAARDYFATLRTAFKPDAGFDGRRRRPPTDPVNSLLSFGYTLLGARLEGLLEARGLEPSVGFYHELRPGRPSLMLDLLEEFRHPIVDRFVIRSFNLGILKPTDFETADDGAVRLNDRGRKTFFGDWENFLLKPIKEKNCNDKTPPLKLLERQVNAFASALRSGEPYSPFLYGG